MPKFVFNAETGETTEEEILPEDEAAPYVSTPEEEAWAALLLEAQELAGVPEWALYTRQEAVTVIHQLIANNKTLPEIEAEITAMPNSFPAVKQALKDLAGYNIAARTVIEKMAIMLVHLRNKTTSGPTEVPN